MFDELDKQNAPQNTPPPIPKTEDIFSEVDKPVKPEPFKPRDNSLPPAGTVIPADDGWLKNKGLIAGLVFGGLIIVFGGGYLGLKYAVKGRVKNESAAVQAETKNSRAPAETTKPAESPAEETAAPTGEPIEPEQPETTGPFDTDQDGLTDEEETGIRTDTSSPDTDQDGLTDREEAKVYGTDPLKADTDGDGYPDGAEIKNGFNPKGTGKLLDINNQ